MGWRGGGRRPFWFGLEVEFGSELDDACGDATGDTVVDFSKRTAIV